MGTVERPTLSAAPAGNYVAIIGDSFTSGTPSGGINKAGWPALVKETLAGQGLEITLIVGAERGSGYGKPGKQGSSFASQVARVVGEHDRLVVLFGSANDRNIAPESLTHPVQRTLKQVKKRAPDARILVIGPAWTLPNPEPGILLARDVVKAQAEAFGATFVDPLAEGWFANRPDVIGDNSERGERPTDAAYAIMAEKIAPLIARELTATS